MKINPAFLNCIDGSQPDTLLYSKKDDSGGEQAGTYALNWRTGQKTTVSAVAFEVCDSYSGMLFSQEGGKVRRFSSQEPKGQLVDFMPHYFAKDGSRQFYAFDYVSNGKRLVSSSDSGLTWQVRPQIFKDYPDNFAVNGSDARSVYITDCGLKEECAVYFSADAGASWEKRGVNQLRSDEVELEPLPGPASVDFVVSRLYSGGFGNLKISTDGGRTFDNVTNILGKDKDISEDFQLFYNGKKIIKYIAVGDSISLSESLDGVFWIKLPLPATAKPLGKSSSPVLRQLPNAPGAFILSAVVPSSNQVSSWYFDSLKWAWTSLGEGRTNRQVTPYLPTSLVAINQSGEVEVQSLPLADKQVTYDIFNNHSSNSTYFIQTGHTLAGPIRRYWEQHGGLAQFGYPQTEPIREVNPADGKVYVVQYFERNRLEYHPELAGTNYEVLLGLLGNQLTRNRRQELPFKPVSNPNISGFTFFPETGHTLAHTFKEYWEAHGGLALYGYPISEEFQEVNPENGKTYTVQYFERNRFEYHPENKGTKYEVLLGLLGNTLLKQYGWLK